VIILLSFFQKAERREGRMDLVFDSFLEFDLRVFQRDSGDTELLS